MTHILLKLVLLLFLSREVHVGGSPVEFQNEEHSSLTKRHSERIPQENQEYEDKFVDRSNKFDPGHFDTESGGEEFGKGDDGAKKNEKEGNKLKKHISKYYSKALKGILHKSNPQVAREILEEFEIESQRTKTSKKGDIKHGDNKASVETNSQQRNESRYLRWVKRFESAQCGQQPIQPAWTKFRIIGGQRSIPGSWPWMASMLFDVMGTHWCAATLISKQWMMTSNHCFYFGIFSETDRWSIRLGRYDISMEEEITEQDYSIKTLIGHPLYNPGNFDNDIALIQLDRPVNLTGAVSPICLGWESPRDNQECVVTGWGKTSETDEYFSNTLRQVAVPILNHDACDELYENLTANMLCAGLFRGGLDSCHGDSGGPLQCQVGDKWFINGITSWGGRHHIECGRPNQPGVYTRLSNYMDWIYGQIYSHTESKTGD